ncbi:TPA: STM2901 family protein [Serratia rubidaea]
MDTVEELGGTYFYKGYGNLNNQQLFWLIWVDAFSQHAGLEFSAAAMVLSGYPFIGTRGKPEPATKGTSIASVVSRKVLPNIRLPTGVVIPTLVGRSLKDLHVSYTNQVRTAVGRNIPWIGYAMAAYTVFAINRDVKETYNRIARPEHRIAWTYF